MKRLLLLLLACLTMALGLDSCRMRYAGRNAHMMHAKNGTRQTGRHYGARKNIWQRKMIWGKKHYGPRPYGHRGRYRY